MDDTAFDTACEVCGGNLLDGDEPGAVMATATEESVLVCSERCTEVAGAPVFHTLRRIEKASRKARLALVDEHEGDFLRDVLELHTHSASLLHTVATW